MKIQELVCNRPSLISQVGSVSTFGCMLQFRVFFPPSPPTPTPPNLRVYSFQCRLNVKLNNANVHSGIIVVHEREKESAIIMCVFSLVLAYVSVYIFVCICMFLYVYVFAKGCIFVSLSVCAGGEWGSVVCLCVEGAGCSPDFSWELQWSMSSAENSRNKPPTS